MAPIPKVCVITLNWNNAFMTKRLLRSLRDQTYGNFESVVVDNGSEDDSAEQIATQSFGARLLRAGTNLGFGAGNNIGLQAAVSAGAEYAWLVNNDAVAEPEALGCLVQTARNHPQAAAVGGTAMELDHPSRVQYVGGGWVYPSLGYARMAKRQSSHLDFLSGTSLLLRMKVFESIGPFDERFFLFWEDADLCFRVRKAGYELAVAGDSRIFHSWSGTAKRVPKQRAHHLMRSFVIFVRKHWRFALPRTLNALMFQSGCKLARGNLPALQGIWGGWRDGWRVAL